MWKPGRRPLQNRTRRSFGRLGAGISTVDFVCSHCDLSAIEGDISLEFSVVGLTGPHLPQNLSGTSFDNPRPLDYNL